MNGRRLVYCLVMLCCCLSGYASGNSPAETSHRPGHHASSEISGPDTSPVNASARHSPVLLASRASIPLPPAPKAGFPTVRPMGVNLPNLLLGYLGLAPGGAQAMRKSMDSARAAGFTHARFIASGYWPMDMTTGSSFVNNPGAYMAAFDELVMDAEARGLRLVPSLLWNIHLWPDISGEPLSALFTPGSETRSRAEAYVSTVVQRYAGRNVILAWEMGNEFNLAADMDVSRCSVCPEDGAANACGNLSPNRGTPCRRTAADNIFSCNGCRGVNTVVQDLGTFTASMAALVHTLDPGKPFSSGNAHPRPAAWHLSRHPCPHCDMTPDSPAQYAEALMQLHPSGVDWISVHHYPGKGRFGDTDTTGEPLLHVAQAAAQKAGRKLFVGEYGEARAGSVSCIQNAPCNGDPASVFTRHVVTTIVDENVPFSAVWAWDYFQACPDVPTCMTILPSDPVADWLQLYQTAAGSCENAAEGAACPVGRCRSGRCKSVPVLETSFATGIPDGWRHWSDCSGCTPSTFSAALADGTQAMTLATQDLPCSSASGCEHPGAYVMSPAAPAMPGRLMVYGAFLSTTQSTVDVLALNTSGVEIAALAVEIPVSSKWTTRGGVVTLPSETVQIRLRLKLAAPHATVTLNRLRADWRP